ncbi:MAG: S1 RNA-binding domain-containing protein [Oscillospiraceae bacterium]|nr:S1 RNA-binding domain-containing protein [Candidatus Equicaccousia limihippi]
MAQIGDIVEGKVTGITGFGAFLIFGENQSGMVHISEVSREFVSDINTVLKVGDTVKAKVLQISDDGKISLSIKKALPPKKPSAPAPYVPDSSYVWSANKQEGSFEEMLSMFKQTSDEKLSDLKRKNNDGRKKRGGR